MLHKHTFRNYILTLLIFAAAPLGIYAQADSAGLYWQVPFPSSQPMFDPDDTITFHEVLYLISQGNSDLKALDKYLQASLDNHRQVSLWPNPEFELELENLGWNAPGFSESEMTILLSQEFDLFGQRKARRRTSELELEYAKWENRKVAFEIFLDAKLGYYRLTHAQNHLSLARQAVELAYTIYNDIENRIAQGAAPQAEFLLSQLEYQKTQLRMYEAERQVTDASRKLSAFWGQQDSAIVVFSRNNSEHVCFKNICELIIETDSSNRIITLDFQKRMRELEGNLARAEAKPLVTLSGGIKRAAGDDFNSFVVGFSFPLPFLDRNQGRTAAFKAEADALKYEIRQEERRLTAEINSHISRILQLDEKLEIIDTLLLPTAEKTYQVLHQAYQAGRMPHSSLLEGERALIDLRFEKNDVYLEIREEQVALETIIGISLDDYNNRGYEHEN